MGRPELGSKCTCAECQERFYDLNRSPAICPKCGAQQPLEKPRVSRPPRSAVVAFHRPRAPVKAIDDDAESVDAPEVEAEEAGDDVPDLDEDVDDDIEIEADRPETTD